MLLGVKENMWKKTVTSTKKFAVDKCDTTYWFNNNTENVELKHSIRFVLSSADVMCASLLFYRQHATFIQRHAL